MTPEKDMRMPTKFQRTIAASAKRDATDGNLVEMAISSEAPYERWFGIEILSHDPSAVDMSRIGDGRHPLLLNHCTGDQIGVIVSASLDDDRVLRGQAKFSQSQLGQEILQDVNDGIRELVSVGYLIDEIEEIEPALDAEDVNDDDYMIAAMSHVNGGRFRPVRKFSGDEFEKHMKKEHGESWSRGGLSATRDAGDEPPTFLVTRWTPFEASIVPVPADVTVGVNRSAGAEKDPAPVVTAPAPVIQPLIIVEKKMPELIQKSPAELEIERRDSIQSLAEQYAKWLDPKDGPAAVRDGKTTPDQFKELIMQKMQSKHSDTNQMHIGMGNGEIKRYSFGRALIAQMTGNWKDAGLELECSRAVEALIGRAPEGFYIPFETFKRDMSVGTAGSGTSAGILVPTQLRTDMYVDALRAAMVMSKMNVTYLAGLTGNVDLPRKSTPATLAMIAEAGSASESDFLTTKATLQPHRISNFTQVSKQSLIQSAMSLEDMIRNDLITGSAVLLENQCINGNGTAPNIKGLLNVSGIGTVVGGTNGLAPTWGNVVDLESACANANAEPDQFAGYLLNTKTRGKLKQTQIGTNLPMIWQNGNNDQPLNGYKVEVTNNLPNNLTKGTSTTVCSAGIFASDWSMTVIGLFGAPDVTVDPYTKADTGQVKITLNQFADMQLRQPACVAQIQDWLA